MELTEEEKRAIKPILDAHFQKMSSTHQQHRKEVREGIRQLRTNLQEILPTEKVQQISDAIRFRKRGNRSPGPPPPGP